MSNELFQQYGYCEIPKGTILYRMGEIYEERGATFALHPRCTMNFTHGSNRLIYDYIVEDRMLVLFLVSHLNKRGFPVSAIKDLHNSIIEPRSDFTDIDIKFDNFEASSKFKEMISNQNILGWLTTIEGNPRLEIFILPSGLRTIRKLGRQIDRYSEQEYVNSLRSINVQPSQLFMSKSEENIQKEYACLKYWSKRQSESMYGLFDKLFV